MSFRSILLGLCLGLFISAFTLFHDNVIQGSFFISHHLPVGVFGSVVLLLLAANPLLSKLGPRVPLRLSEVAVVAAIGLASCGWPSFSFYQAVMPITAMPGHRVQSNSSWQANHVMSYVPGGSHEFGHGHVQDWTGLAAKLLRAADNLQSVPGQVWGRLHDHEQQLIRVIYDQGRADSRSESALLSALNRVIRQESLTTPPTFNTGDLPGPVLHLLAESASRGLQPLEQARLNRWLLVHTFPDELLPPPSGEGLLLIGSEEATSARDSIIQGYGKMDRALLAQIPWATWWPSLRLWGGLALILGVASLCMALLVHPQWSRRELLAYPLAQFVVEIGRPRPNGILPAVTYNQLFWLGLSCVLGIHSLNGLGTWVPQLDMFKIPLTVDLLSLRELFPHVTRVPGVFPLFSFTLSLSVIGFAFFLNTKVSFSVGIAPYLYAACGAAFLARGIAIEQPYMGAGNVNLLRFGAYLGMAGIIVYVGRRYYSQVAWQAIGGARAQEVPGYAVWAVRGLALCFVVAVMILNAAGLGWILASLFIILVLIMFLVLSRIISETGLFFVQSWWMPVAMITALFGIEAVGPTSFIVLALASVVIVGDPRTALMPYLSTGLQMVGRFGSVSSLGRSAWPLLLMIVIGFCVAGLATFVIVHERGVTVLDEWSTDYLPAMPFDELSRHVGHMRSQMTLAEATAGDGFMSLGSLQWPVAAYGWLAGGILLVGLCSIARLRLPWWPIHPVLFLIWGTMPASRLGASFLIGWMIKLAVVSFTGARGYRHVMPLMVGLIAGELLAALGWTIVGVVYYLNTGVTPTPFRVLPG